MGDLEMQVPKRIRAAPIAAFQGVRQAFAVTPNENPIRHSWRGQLVHTRLILRRVSPLHRHQPDWSPVGGGAHSLGQAAQHLVQANLLVVYLLVELYRRRGWTIKSNSFARWGSESAASASAGDTVRRT
ncbi:hypothetical protein SBA2_900010 [Acidobacteriia bacterium SbA2]|nr:hypothetical protein SBA2_900010 [Acidobacteriia bacterium SbA2]